MSRPRTLLATATAAAAVLASGCLGALDDAPSFAPIPVRAAAIPLPAPPPLPPRSEAEPVPPPPAEHDERLQPGMFVGILVVNEPALSVVEVRLGRDGRVFVPYLGRLAAAGKRPLELAREIESVLSERGILRAPQVNVTVREQSGRQVYVLGRVGKPGGYELPFDRPLLLSQLIALAGGLSTHRQDLAADPSAIRLIRTVAGERRSYRIDFGEIMHQGDLLQDVPLQDGDVVFVPPKQELVIFGSVNKPGGFPLADGSRLGIDEVLALAGGFSDDADPSGILLIRRGRAGAQTYAVPSQPLERAALEVTANDTIVVPPRATRRVFVLGSVGSQGAYPLDEPDLTVTKALALAGGLNRLAAGNSVQLIRRGADGVNRVYPVPVSAIIRSGDLDRDPVLEPGDIIWVPEGFF